MKKQMLIFFVGGSLQINSDEEKIKTLDMLLEKEQNNESLIDITNYLPAEKQKSDKIKVRPSEVNAILITNPRQQIFRPGPGRN